MIADIQDWWQQNQAAGKTSLLLCYALGKAQRVLAGLDPEAGPVVVHGAVDRVTRVYRAAGVPMITTRTIGDAAKTADWCGALVLAPPSAHGSPWTRRFKQVSTGFASGWMRVRGQRRRRALDRGFALSDHADWPALLTAIAASGAERVLVTHGQAGPLARFLNEQGTRAEVLATRFVGEAEDAELPAEAAGADAGPEGSSIEAEDEELPAEVQGALASTSVEVATRDDGDSRGEA